MNTLGTIHRAGCFHLTILVLGVVVLDARGTTRYVDGGNAAPLAPYTSWGTAAREIQTAVDACTAGDVVTVTNGVYASGGRVVYGALTNRLVVDRAVVVQSVHGPGLTVIQGYQVAGTNTGDGAIRAR